TAWGVDTERGGSHAGLAETSQMLAVRPDLVREHAYEPGHVGPYNREQMFKGGIKGVSANGILGDPTGGSTAEIGEALLDALSDRLTAVVQERQ
ncbi:MAG: creatininase family protein, partial [Thermaerobacterales bacterium]